MFVYAGFAVGAGLGGYTAVTQLIATLNHLVGDQTGSFYPEPLNPVSLSLRGEGAGWGDYWGVEAWTCGWDALGPSGERG